MKEKKYNFIYLKTNLLNNKQYISEHSTNNLNDNYLGSGLYLKHAIKEYGNENFKKEILEFFNTKEEAFNAQEKYIKEYNTLVPNGYNISPKGGHNVSGCFNDITKEKMSLAKKYKSLSKEHKENIKKATTGKNNPMYGKTVYSIWLQKYGKEMADKKLKEQKEKRSKSLSGKNNPFYGKHHTSETIEMIKQKRKLQTSPMKGKHHKLESNIKNRNNQPYLGKCLPINIIEKLKGPRGKHKNI